MANMQPRCQRYLGGLPVANGAPSAGNVQGAPLAEAPHDDGDDDEEAEDLRHAHRGPDLWPDTTAPVEPGVHAGIKGEQP